MGGIILVFLFIFSSNEGQIKFDKEFGSGRTSAFLHVFELLLMLEHFCKTEFHNHQKLQMIKKNIPKMLNTIKLTINREIGNGMKIIKYHLITHFADDIMRFGSMVNFDSCIGERHHSSEIKKPAKLTQRRKINFEEQTSNRYFEQTCISRAYYQINGDYECNETYDKEYCTNKCNNIIFNQHTKKFQKICSSTRKWIDCNWKDHLFEKQLNEICQYLLENKYCSPPLRFFTQHNRKNIIFRGDPNYANCGPWYDWANVQWDEPVPIPAKILLFMDLNDNFLSPFSIEESFIYEKGSYAISYSFFTAPALKGHLISELIEYGELDLNQNNEPKICFFNVDCIHSPCIAAPYKSTESIVDAKQWLLLKSKNEWYEIFMKLLIK
jgi:hypothetical protein